MRRRALLQAALAAALPWGRAAHAQATEQRHRIGLLLPGTPEGPINVPGFYEGLLDLGYVQVHNLVIERRFA